MTPTPEPIRPREVPCVRFMVEDANGIEIAHVDIVRGMVNDILALTDLPARLDTLHKSTDEMIVALGQRVAALEAWMVDHRALHKMPQPAQQAQPCPHPASVTDEDGVVRCDQCRAVIWEHKQPAQAQPMPHDSRIVVTNPDAHTLKVQQPAQPDADEAMLTNYREGRWIRRNAEACVNELVAIADRRGAEIAALRARLAEVEKQFEDYVHRSGDDYMAQLDALAKRVEALTWERDRWQREAENHRRDLCEIAEGCGVGVADQEEAKRRIIALRAECDRLKADLAAAKRWETGVRNMVTFLIGPDQPFDIDQIVEMVRRLAKCDDNGDPITGSDLAFVPASRLAAATERAEGMERAGAEQARRADQNAQDMRDARASADALAGLLADVRGRLEGMNKYISDRNLGQPAEDQFALNERAVFRIDAALAQHSAGGARVAVKLPANHPMPWAEGLIRQLPESHDGRNSWLLNYGHGADVEAMRAKHPSFRAAGYPVEGE